jgi:SPP1 gp7 family putative phage head morphogenesis protein
MARQDPRLDDATDSPVEEVRDRAISHALYLERFKTQEANRIKAQLRRADDDLLDQIERRLRRIEDRGFDAGPQTTRRLQEIEAAIAEILDPTYRETRDDFAERMVEFAQSEAEWQTGAINQAVGINVEMAVPNVDLMREVVMRRPFQGRLLREWYSDLGESQKTRLREAVRLGITEGQTTDQIVRRIRGTKAQNFTDGILDIGRRQAEAVTRTAVNHVSSQTRSELFKQNSNVVKLVAWTSTLDSRTTAICQARDGKTYPVDEGPRPPAHVGCRSTVAPVLHSWEEMGIDADELPESTRASMNGQVPESLTYNDWLRRQVNKGNMDVVREALGEKRAKLFAAGGLKVDRFVDRRGRQLTLKELRERERDAFEAAGVEI